MKLKLTTARALEYEKRTGNDIVKKMQEIGETGTVTIRDVVDLFSAMGPNYTPDMFDEWEATFVEKATAIFDAVKVYVGGTEEKE